MNLRPSAPGFDGAPVDSAGNDPSAAKSDSALSNAERQRLKKEISSLERKMETRRAKVEELETAMGDIEPTDFTALTEQQQKIDDAKAELDELEMAWLEASERLEG